MGRSFRGQSLWGNAVFSLQFYHLGINIVSQKQATSIYLNISFKRWPILIIFNVQHQKET